jgi:dihydrofolate synthase/folylpolyglutamate synthase
LILTGVENQRSMTAEELSEFVPHNFDKNNVIIVQNAREALQTARNIASNKELICVTGSLYLIGEAQKILSENVL